MLDTRNLLSEKPMYLFGVLLLVFIALSSVAFIIVGSDDFDVARREVLLRRIGHEILLQSGDDTSRVLPVKKIAENEYQLSFEQAFTFQPDLLLNTTQRLLAKDPLAHDYVVNVLNCADASVAYGYAVSKNKKDDIVTCRGRKQPLGCYLINIKFKPRGVTIAKEGYLLGALLFLAFVGFTFLGSGKPRRPLPVSQDMGMFNLGLILFDAATRKLMMNGMTIDLTATETRVLRIFALSPNVTVERSRLQKEIWEDEGVIVGRSLDVFISKLRKKLELDPRIKIVVVRGKGYRLEIGG
jgi:hypothetical protein